MERSMPERLTAEFVGTFTLIFIGAGSVVMFGVLGADRSVGVIGTAFAHGLAIGTMVTAVGHVSGGHFNPAVTIGAWITQKIQSSHAIAYIVTQIAAASAGALLLRASLPKQIVDQTKYGAPLIPDGISNGQAVLIEFMLTFFLVWVIFATAIDPEGAFNKVAGLAIGLVMTMDILMGGFLTGAAMNPARWFGPSLMAGQWTSWWVWLVGPIAGGIVAAALYDGLMIKRPVPVAAEEAPPGVGAPGEDTTA
jgi:aquaporin Z